jgi:Putative sensor
MADDIRRVTGTILRAPFTRRSVRELLYCGFGGVAGVAGFCITIVLLVFGVTISASVLGTVIGMLLLNLTMRVGRRLGGLHRFLARRLLGYRVEAPPKFQPGTGILGRLDKRLRDRAAWRGITYSLVKLPVAAVQLYALTTAIIGLIDITYPVDWLLFHHPPVGPAAPLRVEISLPP